MASLPYPPDQSTPNERPSLLRVIRDEDSPPYLDQEPGQRRGFAMIPAEVFALEDGTAIAVYAILQKHTNKEGSCWPSMKRLEAALGWSDNRIRPALRRLIDAGLVSVERRKLNGMDQSNVYKVTANVQVSRHGIQVSRGGALGIPPRESGYPATGHELDSIELDSIELDIPPIVPPMKALKTGSRKKPLTTLPDDFTVTPAMYDWALRTHRMNAVQVDAKTDQFRDWALAHAKEYADWTAAWRTFMAPKSWDRPPSPPKGYTNGNPNPYLNGWQPGMGPAPRAAEDWQRMKDGRKPLWGSAQGGIDSL